MTKKLLPGLTANALAGIAALGHAFGNRETRDTRRSNGWREDLAEMLEAEITNLDSVVHGYNAAEPTRDLATAPAKRPR